MPIYADYSATTPCCPDAIALMSEVAQTQWGNPSSLHAWGQRSAMVVEVARTQVAELIGAAPEAIVFTSGGTEADNLALLGVARQYDTPQHLIISSVEHAAIANTANWLARQGWQVTPLPVDRHGLVSPDTLEQAIQPNTVLISIIYGQSEVGVVQPIPQLSSIARRHGICFHTDAVQIGGRLSLNVQDLPVDLLSLSSHKLYGPQGVGALYVKPGVQLTPTLTGGGQEQGLRSGTPGVAVIAGFGTAAHLATQTLKPEAQRLQGLRDRLFAALAHIPHLVPTGDRQQRLPHHLSFCLRPSAQSHQSSYDIVKQMNRLGIAISAGSACSSGQLKPSTTLLAMGYSEREAQTAIRITLGKLTTDQDIGQIAQALAQILLN